MLPATMRRTRNSGFPDSTPGADDETVHTPAAGPSTNPVQPSTPSEPELPKAKSNKKKQPELSPHDIERYKDLARLIHISYDTLVQNTSLELWNHDLDLSREVTDLELNSYVGYVLEEYNTSKRYNAGLVDDVQDDFNTWSYAHIKRLNHALKRQLYIFLNNNITDWGPVVESKKTQYDKLFSIFQGEAIVPAGAAIPLRTPLSQASTPTDKTLDAQEPPPRTPVVYIKSPSEEPVIQPSYVQQQRSTSQPPPSAYMQNEPQTMPYRPARTPAPIVEHQPSPYAYTPHPSQYQQQPQPYGGYVQTPYPPGAWHPSYNTPVPNGATATMSGTPVPPDMNPEHTPYLLPPRYFVQPERITPEKIVQFTKAWRKEDNYTGRPYDILVDKTWKFISICRLLDITEAQYSWVYSCIMEDRAATFFTHAIGPEQYFKTQYEKLDARFNTELNAGQYYHDWTSITYAQCREENQGKTPHEVLELMIDKLTLAQRALGTTYQGDEPLVTAVRRAVQGEPEFEGALMTMKRQPEALFADLRTSLMVAKNRKPPTAYNQGADQYYTDRKYFERRDPRTPTPSRGRGNFFRPRSSAQRFQRAGPSRESPRTTKKCFVCKKEGCWSTNYPRDEQRKAKRQYIQAHEDMYGEPPDTADIAVHIQEYEGEDDGSYDEEEDDINDGEEAIHYLTANAFLHRTTGEDPTKYDSAEPAELFILEDRYRTTYQGELWDTGAAKISTVGKAQLKAYVRENPRTKIN
jgi:hypothetical protein